jgi:hypothetical protein
MNQLIQQQQKMNIFNIDYVPPEIALEFKLYGKYISFLRRHPIHAIRVLWGIVIPPHEGFMINSAWQGYRNNIFVCSRGTSKSFTIGSLFPPTKSLLFRNASTLIASASKFRGGKLVLQDSGRLLKGSLKSQKINNTWGISSLSHKTVLIKKDPDMWHMDFNSNSTIHTIPTSNEESSRGIRASILVIDERNTFDGLLIHKVYEPFLAVGSDFENPAEGSEGNQFFSVGTIDYTYRDWYKEIASSQDIAKLEYEIHTALKEKNWPMYDRLREQHGKRVKNASISIIRFDYTDLLIPTKIDKYKINYPGAFPGKQIKHDDRDNCDYIYTYPVAKKQLEDPLDEGLVDRETWEAEQRNMFIRADGNVYPWDLIEKVVGPIFSMAEEKKRKWNLEEQGLRYLPPVLYECSDPCVLGVDTARSQDFSAFVVIRMGNMPDNFFKIISDEYYLQTHMGPSPFSNVVWAEQHQQMTIKEVASKIRELRARYNLVATRNCPGIIMDARGGGATVRDELINPSPAIDPETGLALKGWTPPQKIFDPDDKDERLGVHMLADINAWFGLRLLYTTDIMNQELVGFSKAQMQTNKLFIGNSRAGRIVRDINNVMYPGMVGVDVLKHQLLRVQAVTSPSGKSIQYVMPGDPTSVENKRDMLFAFLYACYGLREWVTQHLRAETVEPVAYGEIFSLTNKKR